MPADELSAAVAQVHDAVAALASSNISTIGESFQVFADAATGLLALGGQATKRGVDGTGDAGAPDPWSHFGV